MQKEWPLDIAIAIVWVIFGINMFGTMMRRRDVIFMWQFGFMLLL